MSGAAESCPGPGKSAGPAISSLCSVRPFLQVCDHRKAPAFCRERKALGKCWGVGIMKCTPLHGMAWAGTQAGSSSQCLCGTQGTDQAGLRRQPKPCLVGSRAPQHSVLSPTFHPRRACEPFVPADSLPLHACPAVRNLPTALCPLAGQPRSPPTPISSSPYCYNSAPSYPDITWHHQIILLIYYS